MLLLTDAERSDFQPVELLPSIAAATIPGTVVRYSAEQEIHGEGEIAEYAYRVISGAVRSFRVLKDGRRQIEAFYFPRQVFSIELASTYHYSTEALCDTRLFAMKVSTIEALIQSDLCIARELLAVASDCLVRTRRQVVLLGRKTAVEKVASFLLELDQVSRATENLVLPMSRYDIADYLGLTIETVSRVLASLQRSNAIDLTSARRVTVRSRSALRGAAGEA